MKKLKFLGAIFLISILGSTSVFSSDNKVTIRGGSGFPLVGKGSSITLGASYMVKPYLEINGIFTKSRVEETSNNGFNDYKEKTDATVFGAVANYLHNYNPKKQGFYFITGSGAALIMYKYEESRI